MELQEALTGRRSVRKFTDEQVSEEAITAILEAARIAPSWANTQVWEFVVVREPGQIAAIVDTFSDKNPATKGAAAASVLIVACARKGVSGCHKGEPASKFQEWFMFDLGLAVQNMSLKAHELGLGSVVVGLLDNDACAKIVQAPDGVEAVAVLPIGYPLAHKDGPPRKPLSDFVHRETF